MKLRKILKYAIIFAILFAWSATINFVLKVDHGWPLFLVMFVCSTAATIVYDNLVWLIPTDDIETQIEEVKESTDWFWGLALPLCVIAVGFAYLKGRGMIPPDVLPFFEGFVGGVMFARFVEVLARNRILRWIQDKVRNDHSAP